mmetsp:Transcript_8393/g.23189  ORF Transcript_8393/g.23189 Transcript_8393/m.23189 type:complete len:932 (+) Transcript_8393:76-2871(+)
MALLDTDGKSAVVGKSLGHWLDEADFVLAGMDHEGTPVSEVGPHTFPRDWPAVYEESEVLRSLVRKRGRCAAKRVSVVPNLADDEHKEILAATRPRRLQSLDTAEAVRRHSGFAVVEGWAIYDILDDVTGAAFLAERYWWNATENSTWLDFTPRPENVQQLLLAESAVSRQPRKVRTLLTTRQHELARHLLKHRFPKATAEAERAALRSGDGSLALTPSSRFGCPAGSSRPAALSTTSDLLAIVKRVELGVADPIYQLANRVENDSELCSGLVDAGMCRALVQRLKAGQKHAKAAARLFAALSCSSSMGCGPSPSAAAQSLLQVGAGDVAVRSLMALVDIAGGDCEIAVATDAAIALGHLCRCCHEMQRLTAESGALERLVSLLGSDNHGASVASAYTLWQVQVGQSDLAERVLTSGAAPALLRLLANCPANDATARLNACGALTPLATVQGAQDALGDYGAVEILCNMLVDESPYCVQGQASAALANLLRGHPGNCQRAALSGGTCGERLVTSLVNLVSTAGSGNIPANAAGALANFLAAGGPRVMQIAAEKSSFSVLAQTLSRLGSSAGLYAVLANLARHLPEDGPPALEQSALEVVVSSLSGTDECIMTNAVGLCMNLARHVPTKSRLVRVGIVKPLAYMMEHPDEVLRLRAVGTLANLMESHPETSAKVFLQSPDLARRLTYALHTEYDPEIRLALARALGLLATRQSDAVRRAGGSEAIITALEETPSWEPAYALLNLSSTSAGCRELLELEVVPLLVKSLGRGSAEEGSDSKLIRQVTGALANLTAESAEACKQVVAAGAMLGLAYNLNLRPSLGSEVVAWTACVIGHMSVLASKSVKVSVAKRTDALAPLVGLLVEGDTFGQEMAIFALLALQQARAADIMELLVKSSTQVRSSLRHFIDLRDTGKMRSRAFKLLRSVELAMVV